MTEKRLEKIKGVIARRQPDLTIVMENIHDPHNVSAILRSADAVGVLEVQLVYDKTEFPKLGKKSSASAIKWMVRRNFKSVRSCFDKLHEEGFTVYATHLGKKSGSLYEIDLTAKIALVFGNEHSGVSAEARRLADHNFMIPMSGMIQSLNVSVACAVSLYEAYRQRMESGTLSRISGEKMASLLAEWTRR